MKGRDLEREDSDLNERTKNVGVNFQQEFIYISNLNLDLRERITKLTAKKQVLRRNPVWENHGDSERRGRIHYFSIITVDSTEVKTLFV